MTIQKNLNGTALTVAVDFKLEKGKGKFGINGKTVK